MLTDFDLIELLSAKISHDLAGPIGAVNNGIELLLQDNCNIKDRAATLIEDSAKEAVVRLQFFRYIYGTVPAIGEANLDHLKQLAAQVFGESKVALDWPDVHTSASEISISHKLGKIALNVIFICSGILIHGGKISVRLHKLANGKRITVTAAGAGLKVDEFLTLMAADKVDQANITSRNAQMYYAYKYCKHNGVNMVMDHKNDLVEFTLEQLRH